MEKLFGFVVSVVCGGIWAAVVQFALGIWWVSTIAFFVIYSLCFEVYKSSTYEKHDKLLQKRLWEVTHEQNEKYNGA